MQQNKMGAPVGLRDWVSQSAFGFAQISSQATEICFVEDPLDSACALEGWRTAGPLVSESFIFRARKPHLVKTREMTESALKIVVEGSGTVETLGCLIVIGPPPPAGDWAGSLLNLCTLGLGEPMSIFRKGLNGKAAVVGIGVNVLSRIASKDHFEQTRASLIAEYWMEALVLNSPWTSGCSS